MTSGARVMSEAEEQVVRWLLSEALMFCDGYVAKSLPEDKLRSNIEQARKRLFAIAQLRGGEPAKAIELLRDAETRYRSLSEQENGEPTSPEEREGYAEQRERFVVWLAALGG